MQTITGVAVEKSAKRLETARKSLKTLRYTTEATRGDIGDIRGGYLDTRSLALAALGVLVRFKWYLVKII